MNNELTEGFDTARQVIARGLSTAHKKRVTEREYDVMIGIGHGESIQDIAKRLHMSPSTASTYRWRILKKLGFTNNAQIVLFVHNELGK